MDRVSEEAEVWAFINEKGGVNADSSFRDEHHVWTICLGWPDAEEIEEAKKRGCRVCRVRIKVL